MLDVTDHDLFLFNSQTTAQGGYVQTCPAGTYCVGSTRGENPCKPLLKESSPCPNGENW